MLDLIIAFILGFIIGTMVSNFKPQPNDNCNHDWKPIKQYQIEGLLGNTYGIISKCRKCGKIKEDEVNF